MSSPALNDMSAFSLRLRGFLHGLFVPVLMGAILFLSAGTVAWPAAWMILVVVFLAFTVAMLAISPGLIMERTQKQAGAKEYDRKLVRVMNFTGLLLLLVAGLDFRFGWTGQIAFPVQAAAFVLFLFGNCIFTWAIISNRFFSLIVRIQDEKGHHPVTSGPYRYVRHPGYLGLLLTFLTQPVILGSLWALIPAIIASGLLVKRTELEDGTLELELEGYEDYTHRVRYRLVPGIW
ncbi:MAG: isoprenylcysteine carboxylmethyltransferase family protein [Methanoregula sp.]|nr:isoprenylcysteine carboxylmethyltransferase family protein [Methanoregula sp.]